VSVSMRTESVVVICGTLYQLVYIIAQRRLLSASVSSRSVRRRVGGF
jgi:hypothetical protein